MNTLLYSIIGIVCLIGISYLFSSIGIRKNRKSDNRLSDFRKKLALTSNAVLNKQYKVDPAVFRRHVLPTRLNIFHPNGENPVL